MPFEKPTLKQLREWAAADIETELPTTDPRLRHSVLNVIVVVMAGIAYGLYGYIDYVFKQVFLNTAEDEHLEKWAYPWGVPRKMADFATGKVLFKGVAGAIIPMGTEVRHASGVLYNVIESYTVPLSGSGEVSVAAVSVGVAGNAPADTKIKLLSPLDGVVSEATVGKDGIYGGVDLETIEDYRERIIERIQNPPSGGGPNDYVRWAKEVPGVTRAWCYPLEMGSGTVTVRFMMDRTYPDGIPQAADTQRVLAYISNPDRKPGAAEVYVIAPKAKPINITIKNLSPDTAEVRKSVENELTDMMERTAVPSGIIYVAHIWEAINSACDHFTILNGADIQMAQGEIPILGVVTYEQG